MKPPTEHHYTVTNKAKKFVYLDQSCEVVGKERDLSHTSAEAVCESG